VTDLAVDVEDTEAAWPSPDEIGSTIWKAQRAVERAAEARLASAGLSSSIFRVLRQLCLRPGQSAADLARRLGFAPQSVAATIQQAEHAGLVKRKPHPVHGRVLQLFLTEAGRDAYTRGASVLRELELELADDLSPAARRLIRRQLMGVAGRAEALVAAEKRLTR
jgi:DNA-binding MarR family transcriptional regulator